MLTVIRLVTLMYSLWMHVDLASLWTSLAIGTWKFAKGRVRKTACVKLRHEYPAFLTVWVHLQSADRGIGGVHIMFIYFLLMPCCRFPQDDLYRGVTWLQHTARHSYITGPGLGWERYSCYFCSVYFALNSVYRKGEIHLTETERSPC